jgi:hypothetical protein
MADKAVEDLITRDWWLLAYVLEFVAMMGDLPPAEAEHLLLDYAWMGWFRDFRWNVAGAWIVYDLLAASNPGQSVGTIRAIPPQEWGKRNLHAGTEVVVEWPHSRVVHRLTSPAPTVSAREIRELLVPFGALPDGYTMRLVCLCGIDVISMTRHAGLLSREGEIALLRAMGFLSPEPPSEKAIEPDLTLKHEMIVVIVRQHYRKGFSAKTTLAMVRQKVADHWEAECQRREVEISEPPHRNTVDEALRRAGIARPWALR